jgi:predicted nucleic acid binding AN1-type Zn finger protein
MADKMIAFCGLDCAQCPAFHASTKLSMEERQKVAEQWSKEFNYQFKAGDIDCVGCTAKKGKQIGNCAVCEMRFCGLKRGIANCAACPDYACAKLEGFLKNVPQARANLEALRGA